VKTEKRPVDDSDNEFGEPVHVKKIKKEDDTKKRKIEDEDFQPEKV